MVEIENQNMDAELHGGSFMKETSHTCDCMGIPVTATNLKSAVYTVCRHLQEHKGDYITFVNVHTLITAVENDSYRRAQSASAYSFADGKPVVWLQKKKGYLEAGRAAGPDFMDAVLKISADKGYRHYFYGGTPGDIGRLVDAVSEKYPGVEIAGSYAPEFVETLDEETFETVFAKDLAEIEKAAPDFIWVGLGAPKQELWMMYAQGRVSGLMAGVGAAFDFISGKSRRAPVILQKLGLEWLYRLAQEPERLFVRYVDTNIKFLRLCMKERLRHKGDAGFHMSKAEGNE